MLPLCIYSSFSVEDAALICGDHVLNVNESIFTAVYFEHLECLLDQVTEVSCFALAVIYLVTEVLVLDLEKVKNWENLTIVGYEGFTDSVGAGYECL